MFSRSTPLPPLQNVPQNYNNLTMSTINNEIQTMKQKLLILNQIYENYFNQFPRNLSKSLNTINNLININSKKINKNRLKLLREALSNNNKNVDALSAEINVYFEENNFDPNINNSMKHQFTDYENVLIDQNRIVLNNVKSKINDSIQKYIEEFNQIKKKTKKNEVSNKFQFTSPFSNNKEMKQNDKLPANQFSTLETLRNLEMHNERIHSLEDKVDLAIYRQDDIDDLGIDESNQNLKLLINRNHEDIRQLMLKSNILSQKFYHPLPTFQMTNKKTKKRKYVRQYEFHQFLKDIEQVNDRIDERINDLEDSSFEKIQAFNSRIDEVEDQIVNFENNVKELNDMISRINDRVNTVEAKQDEIIKTSAVINKSDLSNILESFQGKLSQIQKEAKNDIDSLRKQLDEFEYKINELDY